MKRSAPLAALVSALLLAGCPGDADPPPQPADPAAPATQPAAPGVAAELPAGVTAEMVSQGQQLYATVCVACHGAAGTGTPLGPAMNDQDWIHIDGSFEEIVRISTEGVAQPQRYPAPMPPRGGGNFDEAQMRAISAYVYSLSRGG
jgi:mono/diheme cytochrome c family protein